MPLRITNSTTDVAVINRWAEEIESRVNVASKQAGHALTTLQNTPPVVIPPSVNDGLIHGDKTWGLDPGWVDLRDDFALTSIDSSGVLGNFTSEMAWVGIDGSGGEGTVFAGGPYPNQGYVYMGASASVNTQSFLLPHLTGASVQQYGMPIFDYPGWKLVWIFGINRKGAGTVPAAFDWSHISFYLGLGSWPGQTSNTPPISRPPFFAGLRYDTDTTAPAISDTQFVFEYIAQAPVAGAPARVNTQGTTQATGITAVEGAFYRFELTYLSDTKLLYSLSNGSTTFTKIITIARTTLAPTPTLSVSNGIATYTSPGSVNIPWSVGSKVILASITGTASSLNGTWTIMPANLQSLNAQWLTSVTPFASTAGTNGTTSFYPALVPCVVFGNDSTATPITKTKGILVDFFSFIWNPGINGGTGTPNVNKSRYW